VRVVVLAKEVPDLEAAVKVAAGGSRIEVEKRRVLNYFDEIAVEAALQLKADHGAETAVVSAGAGAGVEAIRRAVAMGIEAPTLIDDAALEGADPLTVARALAAVVTAEPYDVVLAGKQATDDEAGLVGPMVAEILGIPCVTGVTGLEVAAGVATVTREVEGGTETLRVPLPALLTAEKGLCEPRVPGMAGTMKAMKVQIPRTDLSALGVTPRPPLGVTGYSTVGERPPVTMIEGEPADAAAELVRLLREEAKVL
jgi:electron transfer flavoprotein beta subunit